MVLPHYFKTHKKAAILICITLGFLVIGSFISNYYMTYSSNNEDFQMHMGIQVKIDGKTVYDNPNDLIMGWFYAYNFCKMFNDSGACGLMSGFWYGNSVSPFVTAYGCTTYNTAGTANHPNFFTASTRCSATAAFLSQDTQTPSITFPSIYSYINSSGLAPVQATTVSSGGNVLTMTATFTATSPVSGINRAEIGIWNDKVGKFVHQRQACGGCSQPFFYNILTDDQFSTQSVNTGQAFQVIWTVSM